MTFKYKQQSLPFVATFFLAIMSIATNGFAQQLLSCPNVPLQKCLDKFSENYNYKIIFTPEIKGKNIEIGLQTKDKMQALNQIIGVLGLSNYTISADDTRKTLTVMYIGSLDTTNTAATDTGTGKDGSAVPSGVDISKMASVPVSGQSSLDKCVNAGDDPKNCVTYRAVNAMAQKGDLTQPKPTDKVLPNEKNSISYEQLKKMGDQSPAVKKDDIATTYSKDSQPITYGKLESMSRTDVQSKVSPDSLVVPGEANSITNEQLKRMASPGQPSTTSK